MHPSCPLHPTPPVHGLTASCRLMPGVPPALSFFLFGVSVPFHWRHCSDTQTCSCHSLAQTPSPSPYCPQASCHDSQDVKTHLRESRRGARYTNLSFYSQRWPCHMCVALALLFNLFWPHPSIQWKWLNVPKGIVKRVHGLKTPIESSQHIVVISECA